MWIRIVTIASLGLALLPSAAVAAKKLKVLASPYASGNLSVGNVLEPASVVEIEEGDTITLKTSSGVLRCFGPYGGPIAKCPSEASAADGTAVGGSRNPW
jgi:hypothetical protein